MIYGYACASSEAQLAAQQATLVAAGAAKVFLERSNVSSSDRPTLNSVIHALRRDDALIVTRLEQLACSSSGLLNIFDDIIATGAGIKSLSEPWADTTMPHRYLLAQIIAGLAEFERSSIRTRTAEGIKRAKTAGVQLGRPSKLTDSQREEALKRREAGDSLREVAATYGCSYMTIKRLVYQR